MPSPQTVGFTEVSQRLKRRMTSALAGQSRRDAMLRKTSESSGFAQNETKNWRTLPPNSLKADSDQQHFGQKSAQIGWDLPRQLSGTRYTRIDY